MLKRKKWLAFLLVVCMLLTAMPVSAFADTGSGDERTLVCGLEESAGHTHDESCVCPGGELICGLEEGGHVHNDACYTEEQQLICTSEDDGHEHAEECYKTEKILTCGLEETQEVHVHNEDCYCKGGEYICGLEESEGHVHAEECYVQNLPQAGIDYEKETMDIDLLTVPEGEAACTYESTDGTVTSSEAVTMKEAVEALNNAGGGTIKVVNGGLADWNIMVESNITIIPANESNQVVIGLKEPDDYVGGQSSKDGMFQVKNNCVLTFGAEGLPEECLVFSGRNIEYSCIVTADEGYSTARVILNEGVLLTKCLDSAIGKHHDGSGVSSRSPHVEIHGAKVAYNGTKENPAYDSAIKSRSFTMTSGVICENYSGGGAGAIEINDGLKFVDDLDCRISGDSLIENCGSDTCGAILAEDLYISGNVTIRNCYGEDLAGAIYCGGDIAEISGLTIEYCKGGSAGAINSLSEELIIKDDVRISNCELIAEYNNIKMAGAIYCLFDLTIEGGEKGVIIENCKGIETAGAIYAKGTTTSIGGNVTLKNNTANYGGAICTNSRQMDIKDGVQIINNTAQIAGGGIYVDGIDKNYITYMPHVTIYGGTIQENEAPKGGGIYLSSSYDSTELISAVVLKGGNIINNTAKDAGGGIYQSYGSYIYVSGSPNVTNNKTNDVTDNICLGWNGVHEVDGEQEIASFDDVYQSFKDGQDSFVAVFGKMYMNYFRTLIEAQYSKLDEEEKVNAAKQLGLNDYVITDDDTGEEKYIGTKEQFIDAYLKYTENALKVEIIEIYERLQKLPEEEQKKSLEKIYNQLKDIASIANSINAYITVVGALDDNAKIGITSEYPKYKRLVVEGGVDAKENADGEAYVLTDKDLKAFSSDNTYYSVEYNPQNKNQFVLMNFIKISPADVIIYMGGESYEGVTDENGNIISDSTGLPEPGFVLEIPEEFNIEDIDNLYLQYNDGTNKYKWKFVPYGDGEENLPIEKKVFRIEPADETLKRDVRVNFIKTNGDDKEVVASDNFVAGDYVNQTLEMEVYGEGIESGNVTFIYEDEVNGKQEHGVSVENGTLTVLGTTTKEQYGEKKASETDVVAGEPAMIEKEGTIYTINGSSVAVDENAQIALLFDNIINSADENREELLKERAEEFLKTTNSSRSYEIKYLDLVDRNNGNMWVTAQDASGNPRDITIYWPIPENMGKDVKVKILHFKDLHRDTSTDEIESSIEQCVVEEVPVTKITDTHVVFESGAKGFSPFALVWEVEDTDNGNDFNSSGSSGGSSTKYYTFNYESNGGTEYDDERYKKNTVVDLDKVPVRMGYTFTGWYADEELTEKITDIKMTSDKTVYAGWVKSTVPDQLNGDDHFAYVVGYPDGSVQPNGNITRAEVAAIFFRLLQPEVRDGNLSDTNVFTDVTENDWHNVSVSTMAELNIIKGRTETTFVPDAPITRAEFAAICARFDTGLTEGDSNLTDISGHWAEEEIERAVSLGWIAGYPDGTFKPNQFITRAEAVSIINRVLCRMPEEPEDLLSGMNIWPDNMDTNKWYYLAVQEATNSHTYEHKGEIHETWLELIADPDWSRYNNI